MLPYAVLALNLLALRQVPAGTQLHVRLATEIGSFGSKVGSPVSAVLIAPVVIDGATLLAAGSRLTGVVTRAQAVGFGIVHETASLAIDFNDCKSPEGATLPVGTRLIEVDNSRESVLDDGSVRGLRTTGSISYRVSGYIRTALAWEIHARIAIWAFKTLLVQVPEPEIHYPAGVELTLALTDPLITMAQADPEPGLDDADREDLRRITAGMPYRAYARRSNRPSDLINVLFAGSRQEIEAAFRAAGWTQAKPSTLRTRIQGIRAVAENRGDRTAPMSMLLVNDRPPDMLWQKGLNDFAKRHHIRVWKQPETWDGQELWVGAATRDVDLAFLRRGQTFTHRVAEQIDEERDKIANDFEFTACTDVVDWWDRPGAPMSARNATGDLMDTDGRLAVIRLNSCASPNMVASSGGEPLRVRPNPFLRFVRRQILSVRSDYYRQNMYWRTYEGTRWMVEAIRNRRRGPSSKPSDLEPSGAVAASRFSRIRNSSWLR